MPESQPIVGTATLNAWVYRHADAAHLRSDEAPELMRDPSVAQTRRAQESSSSEQLGSFAWDAAKQLVSLSPTRLGFIMGAAAPALTAVELATRQLEASEQGRALKRAYVRDAMHLAVLNLASNALPRAFVERAAHELRASRQGAEWILTRLVTSPEFETNRTALERHAQRGMQAARARGIVDAESLALARQDPSFDTQFRNDPAFRFGVRAELSQTVGR